MNGKITIIMACILAILSIACINAYAADLSFTDLVFSIDGQDISTLTCGEIRIEAYASNSSENSGDITLLAAVYKGGIIENIEYSTLPVAGEAIDFPINLEARLEIPDNWGDGYSIKAMIWSGFPEIIPLSNFNEIVSGPTIIRVSDAISPGEVFTIYGEYFSQNSIIELDGTIIESILIDREGHFITAIMPDSFEAGVYNIRVKNEFGWSKTAKLNAPRPQWISTDVICPGVKVILSGRNLEGAEFGMEGAPSLKLGSFYADIIDINPYAVEFTVDGNIPVGEYNITYSSDGITWRGLEYDQTLMVKAAVNDPYNLGVAWADEFNWNQQLNVKSYGAFGDGDTNPSRDDTNAIKTVMWFAEIMGGGVVYFPDGYYPVSSILEIPPGVVLAGSDGAVIICRNTLSNTTIFKTNSAATTEGRVGIYNLTIKLDPLNPAQVTPDTFMYLGNGFTPGRYKEGRTAEKIFVKNVKIDYRKEKRAGDGRGIGLNVLANKYVLIDGCEFSGYAAHFGSNYVSRYAQLSNNILDSCSAQMVLCSTFSLVLNNSIIFSPKYDPLIDFYEERRGLDIDGPVYVAENYIENDVTDKNEGEVINLEANQGTTKMFGAIMAGSSSSVTVEPLTYIDENNEVQLKGSPEDSVNPQNTWDMDKEKWSVWHIVITEGRGMGQYREIKSADRQTKIITVTKPWEIIPDETSKFTVIIPERAATIYNNKVNSAGKTFCLYLNSIDVVVAGNKGQDCEGIFMRNYNTENATQKDCRFTVGYFVRITGNVITGVSPTSRTAAIGVEAGLETDNPYAYLTYGIDIKNNHITGDLSIPYAGYLRPKYNGNDSQPGIDGLYALNYNTKANTAPRDITKAVFFEGNDVVDSKRGITIGSLGYTDKSGNLISRCRGAQNHGLVLKNNTFTNVTAELTDDGSKDVVIIDMEGY